MKNLVLFIATLFIVSMAIAQDAPIKKSKVYGGMGYFQTGVSFLDLDDLNAMLKSNDMPELGNASATFGGGGQGIIGNFIIGGEGHGVMGNSGLNQTYRVTYGSGYGLFNMGYVVYSNPVLLLYPMLGIGGGGQSVTIIDRSSLPVNFSDILEDPKHQSVLTKGSFLIDLSLTSNLFVFGHTGGNASGGFLVGLRAGYLLELNNDRWYIDDQELVGGPNSGMSGPYIRLIIGGGGFSR
jgi:hypothetical protein